MVVGEPTPPRKYMLLTSCFAIFNKESPSHCSLNLGPSRYSGVTLACSNPNLPKKTFFVDLSSQLHLPTLSTIL